MNVTEFILSYMDGYTFTITLVILVTILYTVQLFRFYSGTPPGPWGIPIFGYMPFLSKSPPIEFVRLAKKYGDVFSFSCGSRFVVILNGPDAIKQGLKVPGFDGRPQDLKDMEFGEGKSIVVTDGNLWRAQKTFLLRAMRDFGSGKSPMEDNIHRESEHAIAKLKKLSGKPEDIIMTVRQMTCNVISCLVFGKRFSTNDKSIEDAILDITNLLDQFDLFGFANSFPKLVTFLPQKLTGVDYYRKLSKQIYDFSDKIIEEHKKTFDEHNLRDLVDWYLSKTKENGNGEENIYSEDYMRANINGLFVAGVDTTAIVVSGALLVLAAHPDVQKAVQAELDEVIGRERLPMLTDKKDLPYTEAVILEIHRFISLAGLTAFHRATEEITFNGYRIPKDTSILYNLWNNNRSPDLWDNPDQFDPQRFLDQRGKLAKCADSVIPFSVGRRNCIGEIVAKMEIFLFITALVQNFTFTVPEGKMWKFDPDMYVPMVKLHKYIVSALPRK